jgi:predicted Rossmann fold nucleotide-binding protein DprA/Smf involved in DNA uptake
MTPKELEAYYANYLSSGIGAQWLMTLRDYFGSAEIVLTATASQLRNSPGFCKIVAADFIESREKALETAKKHLASLPESVRVIICYDSGYPDQLKSIYQPSA